MKSACSVKSTSGTKMTQMIYPAASFSLRGTHSIGAIGTPRILHRRAAEEELSTLNMYDLLSAVGKSREMYFLFLPFVEKCLS